MPHKDRLVWLDLEMTGLDPDRHTIVEIATLVTDNQLRVLDGGVGPTLAIAQTQRAMDSMEEWSRKTHTQSGLLAYVTASTISLEDAETQTLNFIKKFCLPQQAPLCGNSVGHDRRFLARYMPTLHGYFHYRTVDVSTIKELVRRWFPHAPQPQKKRARHRALDDIQESLAELIFYRDYYFKRPEHTDPSLPAPPPRPQKNPQT